MASDTWLWDPKSRRYRSAITGRWLSHVEVADLRTEFAVLQRSWADVAAAALTRRDWTVRRWELEVRARLKTVYLAEYLLGRGGKAMMTSADYGRVGAMLATQYGFLRGFAVEIQDGTLSEAQIAARTQLYHTSAIQAFERGKAAAYSVDLILPAYPADGGTRCLTNCRCRWSIRETKRAWKAFWRRTKQAESCDDCVARERQYNPYIVTKATPG
jgi:hypothetical protein